MHLTNGGVEPKKSCARRRLSVRPSAWAMFRRAAGFRNLAA